MTDTEIKLREMEERIKKLEDAVFNTWFNQYQPVCDFEHNYSWEPVPYIPTHACSLEQQQKAMKEYEMWKDMRPASGINNDAFVKVNHD